MKKLLTSVAAVLASVATPLVVTAPAQAAGSVDLYNLRSPGLHVNSGSCRDVTITANTTAGPDIEEVDAEVDVWLGGKNVGTASLSASADPSHLRGTYFYCPGLDGVGKFRLGDTQLSWFDTDFNDGSRVDGSRGSMTIKQATRGHIAASRRGRTR